MTVTLLDMNNDELIPMRSVYQRNGVTVDLVAKARKEALEAETERTLKIAGAVSNDELPFNLTIIGKTGEETLLLHRTVDHKTRLAAAEAVAEELGLKPSKKVDVNMAASGILAEVLKEIDGGTLGIPSKRREHDE